MLGRPYSCSEAKFRCPRNTVASKELEGLWKPQIHLVAVHAAGVCDGHSVNQRLGQPSLTMSRQVARTSADNFEVGLGTAVKIAVGTLPPSWPSYFNFRTQLFGFRLSVLGRDRLLDLVQIFIQGHWRCSTHREPARHQARRALAHPRYYLLTDEMMQDSNCQATLIAHHLDVVMAELVKRTEFRACSIVTGRPNLDVWRRTKHVVSEIVR